MQRFLVNNRAELVERCTAKLHARSDGAYADDPLSSGVPMLLGALIKIFAATEAEPTVHEPSCACVPAPTRSELDLKESSKAHGRTMLALGYSIDDVVRSYGDLCQAITQLAFELDTSFSVSEFGQLNRCLDEAIAYAVASFSQERVSLLLKDRDYLENQRKGFLVHELRNALSTSSFAIRAIEVGNLPLGGATGAVLKRSISGMIDLIKSSQSDVRDASEQKRETFSVADFLADAEAAAQLYGPNANISLVIQRVDASLVICGNRGRLLAALDNLIQNAFKFTHPDTAVKVSVRRADDSVLIEVADHCGGLAKDSEQKMFKPFSQMNGDKSGLGLGLVIARQSVEADLGTLSVRSLPDVGCVFTMSLPEPRNVR